MGLVAEKLCVREGRTGTAASGLESGSRADFGGDECCPVKGWQKREGDRGGHEKGIHDDENTCESEAGYTCYCSTVLNCENDELLDW